MSYNLPILNGAPRPVDAARGAIQRRVIPMGASNDTTNSVPMKRCRVCERDLDVSNFYRDPKNPDGRKYVCTDCVYTKQGRLRPPTRFRRAAIEGYKLCTKCNKEYPATTINFPPSRQHKDGLAHWCRECRIAYRLGLNRAKGILPKSRYILPDGKRICSRCGEAHPHTIDYFPKMKTFGLEGVCRNCRNESDRRWKKENLDKIREIQRKNRTSAKGRLARKGIAKIFNHNRRARKRSLPNTFTGTDWQRALDYWQHRCAVCGRPAGFWHVLSPDHWIPLTDPRPDNPGTVPWNIVPLCHALKGGEGCCNNLKGNRDPAEWLMGTQGKKEARSKLAEVERYFQWIMRTD